VCYTSRVEPRPAAREAALLPQQHCAGRGGGGGCVQRGQLAAALGYGGGLFGEGGVSRSSYGRVMTRAVCGVCVVRGRAVVLEARFVVSESCLSFVKAKPLLACLLACLLALQATPPSPWGASSNRCCHHGHPSHARGQCNAVCMQ
jgi:hypothetical protein